MTVLIDVHPDMWMPNWKSAWDEYVEGNQTIAANAGYPGTSLLYVPSYMSDKISSIDDLKKPEIAAMFDDETVRNIGLVISHGHLPSAGKSSSNPMA